MERVYSWSGERSRLDASVRGCSLIIDIDDNAANLRLASVIPRLKKKGSASIFCVAKKNHRPGAFFPMLLCKGIWMLLLRKRKPSGG